MTPFWSIWTVSARRLRRSSSSSFDAPPRPETADQRASGNEFRQGRSKPYARMMRCVEVTEPMSALSGVAGLHQGGNTGPRLGFRHRGQQAAGGLRVASSLTRSSAGAQPRSSNGLSACSLSACSALATPCRKAANAPSKAGTESKRRAAPKPPASSISANDRSSQSR